MSREIINFNLQRAQMNLESRLIMKQFRKATDMSITILSADTDDNSRRDQWLGFVQTIKVYMHSENR